MVWGFPGGTSGKRNSPANSGDIRDMGLSPGSGRFPPGEGNGNPLQHPCLEFPMGKGAWWGCKESISLWSQTRLKRLSKPHLYLGWWNSIGYVFQRDRPAVFSNFPVLEGLKETWQWPLTGITPLSIMLDGFTTFIFAIQESSKHHHHHHNNKKSIEDFLGGMDCAKQY